MKKIKVLLLLIGILGLLVPVANAQDNGPICVFGAGIANKPQIEGKYVYGDRLPVIAINPYDGDLIKAAGDYLHSSRHNGRGVVDELERVYQEKGRVDYAFFHSAAVVALNGGAEKLDESLSTGRLRLGKLVLAGVHVQPKLRAVLDKHKETGSIGDWLALEHTYIPGKEKGDLIVLFTTPNKEFRSSVGGAVLKVLIGFEVGIIKFPALISGGKWDIPTPFYDFRRHLIEVYTLAARNFFDLEKTDTNQALAQAQSEYDLVSKN